MCHLPGEVGWVGGAKGSVGLALRDMLAYWFHNMWPVVVYVGVVGVYRKTLVWRSVSWVARVPLVVRAHCGPSGVQRPGEIYHDIEGLNKFAPPCDNAR